MHFVITSLVLSVLTTFAGAAPVEPAVLQRRCTPGAYNCLNLYGIAPDEIVCIPLAAIAYEVFW